MYSFREVPPESVMKNLDAYDDKTQILLYARGIETQEEAEQFFQREWNPIPVDSYADMHKAVQRTLQALTENETIGIYSDYDCDGIPAAAALYSTLRAFKHTKIQHYTPGRNVDGFGINEGGIQKLADAKVTLVFVIDCGTAHPEGIQAMQNAGMDVVILDHHLPGEVTPEPFAMINPVLEENSSSVPLCAAGVTYMFLHALVEGAQTSSLEHKPPRGWEKWQLDLVALATISDMMPLHGLNRQLVHYGLQVARKSPRPGIQALCRKLRINQKQLTQTDFSFSFIPRINAASRMGDAAIAFALLTAETLDEALQIVNALESLNSKRKTAVGGMVRSVHKQIPHKDANANVWVFGDRSWKPSLAGLVAQKIAEEYDKTVFVWGQTDSAEGKIKGSCRSKKHDTFTMMEEAKKVFAEYGGHRNAGGFTLLPSAEITIEKQLNATETAQQSVKQQAVADFVCSVGEVTELSALYNKFSPFGLGNENIVTVLEPCALHSVEHFGKHKEHTKYTFQNDTHIVSGVTFFTGNNLREKSELLKASAEKIQVCASVEWDTFRGALRLRVTDMWSVTE